MKKYNVNGKEMELGTVQDPYITGTNEDPRYEGKAISGDGREYWLTWKIRDDYDGRNGEEAACDWYRPARAEPTGETLEGMICGGESRNNPGRACDYIIIKDAWGDEIAYSEELIGESDTEDPGRYKRLVKDILDQLD